MTIPALLGIAVILIAIGFLILESVFGLPSRENDKTLTIKANRYDTIAEQ